MIRRKKDEEERKRKERLYGKPKEEIVVVKKEKEFVAIKPAIVDRLHVLKVEMENQEASLNRIKQHAASNAPRKRRFPRSVS